MSNNASSGSDNNRKPENPQETLKEENYYYGGFFAAEMTCSVIKAANYNPVGHYYFAIDITVSNADRKLLAVINKVVMKETGVITPIKGAFNLSSRGKRRVQITLDFLDQYPIVTGDCARNRIELIREALAYLKTHRGSHAHRDKSKTMDVIRMRLRQIKETGTSQISYPPRRVSIDAVGHFLAGVLDGEGSFGLKKSGSHYQPFIAIAMKDRKIIELFQKFLQCGNVRKRKDGLYHYELNRKEVLLNVSDMFLNRYPLRHARQRRRMQKLQRILNDYTRNPVLSREMTGMI